MNVEAANDVDLNYSLNPRSIVSMSVGIVWASILILVYLQGKICVGEWCCEVVGSCEVQQVASCSFLLPRSLI